MKQLDAPRGAVETGPCQIVDLGFPRATDPGMPPRTAPVQSPRHYVSGPFRTGTILPGAPPSTRVQQDLAREVARAPFTRRQIARRAQLSTDTVDRLLSGDTWCDIITLVNIADVLGLRLAVAPKAR